MQNADHILIPLLDGKHALAQVARVEMGRILIYLTRGQAARTSATTALTDRQIIAAVCIDATALPDGHWPVFGYDAVPRIAAFKDIPLADMETIDPAIVEAFANAVHGLYPWDGFPDPDYFTNLLRSPDVRPTMARMSADFPKPDTT